MAQEVITDVHTAKILFSFLGGFVGVCDTKIYLFILFIHFKIYLHISDSFSHLFMKFVIYCVSGGSAGHNVE